MKTRQIKNLAGQKFNRLTAIKISHQDRFGHCFWECNCECGNVKIIASSNLITGSTKSCGCLRTNINSKNGLYIENRSNHALYSVWGNMKDRCLNTKHRFYNYYGGRGIKICKEWVNDSGEFINWALENGWDKGLEIDRIDNNGMYSPSNCRFITHKENTRNTRFSKLTSQDIKEILWFLSANKLNQQEIANIYNVSFSIINSIKNGRKTL